MVNKKRDASALKICESFMESAPQLILQMYILIKDEKIKKEATGDVKIYSFIIFVILKLYISCNPYFSLSSSSNGNYCIIIFTLFGYCD